MAKKQETYCGAVLSEFNRAQQVVRLIGGVLWRIVM